MRKNSFIIISILAVVFIGQSFSQEILSMSNEIQDIYIRTYAYSFLGEKISVRHILLCSFIMSVDMLVFADIISEEIGKNATYIFTRTKKRIRYLMRVLKNIFLKLFALKLVQFAVSFLQFTIMGYEINDVMMTLNNLSRLFILLLLSEYSLILIINSLSLVFDDIYSYMIGISSYFISIISLHKSVYSNIEFTRYIPLTQYIINIYEDVDINRSIEYYSMCLPNYRISYGIIYSLIFIGIWMILGTRFIKNKEFY